MYFPESNILQIEDCIIYDPMTSDTGKWILNNNPIINYNENGCTISKTTNGEAQYILNSSIPIPVVIEFTHVTGSGRSSLGCQFDKGFVLHWDDGSNNLYQIYRFLSSTSTSTSFISKTESIGSNDKLKIIIHDNTMELWKNGAVLLSSPSYQWETTSGFWFYTNWNRSQTVKDLKIKPYSEE